MEVACADLPVPMSRDGRWNCQVELSENRLEIGEAASKRIGRYDVPITRGDQHGQAKIQHAPYLLWPANRRREIGKCVRAQPPDQAIDRSEDRREAQIHHDRAVKTVKGNPARRVDRVRYDPNQRREGKDFAGAMQHGGLKPATIPPFTESSPQLSRAPPGSK